MQRLAPVAGALGIAVRSLITGMLAELGHAAGMGAARASAGANARLDVNARGDATAGLMPAISICHFSYSSLSIC